MHDNQYDKMAKEVNFGSDFLGEETKTYRQCFYSLLLYPSAEFEKTFESDDTEKFTALLAAVFSGLAFIFFVFVWHVSRRQQRVMAVALRTTAIISNLFPANVKDRIMAQAEEEANRDVDGAGRDSASSALKTILQENNDDDAFGSNAFGGAMKKLAADGVMVLDDAPIADLYPNCTVFFGDLVGFTAWGSTRDPAQVFVLLETLYGAFDAIAKNRHIFKVETIGKRYKTAQMDVRVG